MQTRRYGARDTSIKTGFEMYLPSTMLPVSGIWVSMRADVQNVSAVAGVSQHKRHDSDFHLLVYLTKVSHGGLASLR
jgi:hypothetical protein